MNKDCEQFERLTLREKLTEAERLIRELSQKMDSGIVPMAKNLNRLARHFHDGDGESHPDPVALRDQASDLLANDRVSATVRLRLSGLLQSIQNDVDRIANGG